MAAKKKDSAAEHMMSLFAGYSRASGTHGVPHRDGPKWSIKKTAKTLTVGPSTEMWQKHLDGERPLGVVPIMDDSNCVWGSVDIDQYDIDPLEVIGRVESMKLPLVPCRSKSGGLHLFLFMREPTPASTVQVVLRNLAAVLGFADSEIFPKQTQILAEKGDSGNWMVMPYYGDTFGGKLKYQHGLKKTGAEMTVEEFLTFAEKSKVTEEQISDLRHENIQPETRKRNGRTEKKPFGDGPVCLQNMASGGFPEGGRNSALMMIGVYLKKAFPSQWKEMLVEDNNKYMRPPLPIEEVLQVQKQLEKKDYEYMCKTQPMSSHCDSITCRTRRHGVGNDAYPEILAIRKLMTEPAIWFIDVLGRDGTVTLCLTTEQAMNYYRFQLACLVYGSIMQRTISQKLWGEVMSDALSNRSEFIPAPPDLGTGGRFAELLETFLTNRQKGDSREDLLRGVPWESEEDGCHYFRLSDLQRFLDREGAKMNRTEVFMRIKAMHKSRDPKFSPHKFMRVKDRGVNVWWVPSSAIGQAPELDPPALPGDKI